MTCSSCRSTQLLGKVRNKTHGRTHVTELSVIVLFQSITTLALGIFFLCEDRLSGAVTTSSRMLPPQAVIRISNK